MKSVSKNNNGQRGEVVVVGSLIAEEAGRGVGVAGAELGRRTPFPGGGPNDAQTRGKSQLGRKKMGKIMQNRKKMVDG